LSIHKFSTEIPAFAFHKCKRNAGIAGAAKMVFLKSDEAVAPDKTPGFYLGKGADDPILGNDMLKNCHIFCANEGEMENGDERQEVGKPPSYLRYQYAFR
jgi:hypothetical protein